MPVVEQAKVPLLNAGSSSIKVTEPGNPWTFRIMPNEVMQGINLAENAAKRMKAQTAVLLLQGTPMPASAMRRCSRRTSPSSAARFWRRSASAATSTTLPAIATPSPASARSTSFRPTRLKAEGLETVERQALAKPDRQGRRGDRHPDRHDLAAFGFEQKAGKAALGYIRIVQFDPTDPRDVAKIASAFKAKYNADPTHLNAHAYDQIMLIADVVDGITAGPSIDP